MANSLSLVIVPDNLLMQIIRERLNRRDCITQGWIMIGFPRTRTQTESLARTPNTTPNRYGHHQQRIE